MHNLNIVFKEFVVNISGVLPFIKSMRGNCCSGSVKAAKTRVIVTGFRHKKITISSPITNTFIVGNFDSGKFNVEQAAESGWKVSTPFGMIDVESEAEGNSVLEQIRRKVAPTTIDRAKRAVKYFAVIYLVLIVYSALTSEPVPEVQVSEAARAQESQELPINEFGVSDPLAR